MNKSLLLLALLSACQAGTPTPQNSATPAPQTSAQPSTPLVGGYSSQPTNSPEASAIKSNAQNLLNQKYPGEGIVLGALKSYETQVVAGLNHRLEAEYSDADGHKGTVRLVVYQDLKQAYTLSEDNYAPHKK